MTLKQSILFAWPKANYKRSNPSKLVTSGISDVANASVHSEKTRAKKWIMIIGERAKRERHSQVCSIENRGYYWRGSEAGLFN